MEEKLQPRLEVKHIFKAFQGKNVVAGLSFEVMPGEIVGLLGPNGAGKTTAFYITAGLISADQGEVFFEGENVTSLPIHLRAQKGIGYLAQEPSVFRELTVEENVLSVLETLSLKKEEKKERLQELLEELRLDILSKKRASSLSGGERRRLEITRALATNPRCLMLDEPFANIDPISVDEVKHLIRHLANRGISILITDHNAREIFSSVDRSYLVYEGKAILSGTKEEILESEMARRLYLGLEFKM